MDDWDTTYAGCSCCCQGQEGACTDCECIVQGRRIYDQNGRLLNVKQLESMPPINECHAECSCDESTCLNRVVQKGCQLDLEVFDCAPSVKGRGLRTRQHIPAGSFVIEYMGEVIGPSQASQLLKSRQAESNYIMFLREHFPLDHSVVTTIIDARNYSNSARFVNHSCEPNLVVLPVRIDNMVPHAALFAKRDIAPNEELSYDYSGHHADTGASAVASDRSCLCESANCRGFLPRSDV